MDGFIRASNSTVPMRAYNGTTVQVLSSLALEYALFDAFYASVPSSTSPNRAYIHSASSNGVISTSYEYSIEPGFPQRTFYDDLEQDNVTWSIYFHDFPISLQMKSLRHHHMQRHLHVIDEFYNSCLQGTLPSYSFLEPRWIGFGGLHESAQHPPHNILDGERLLQQVYEAVRAGPDWNRTVLIVTYDEHGGLYDHVVPPEGCPNPDGVNNGDIFNFTRLGIRVPFVVISPHVPAASLFSAPTGPNATQYDHTSVLKTVRQWLQTPTQRPLTKREAWSSSFAHVLSLKEPRTDCPMKVAMGMQPDRTDAKQLKDDAPLSELQHEVVDLASQLLKEKAPLTARTSRKGAAMYVTRAYKKWKAQFKR